MTIRRLTLLTNPDVCNLHCPLCFLNQRGRPFGMGEMSFDIAKAAIEKYAEAIDENGTPVLREVIPSTMGEPLLYSHFEELLELCAAKKIPMNITTNGTFPGKWGCSAGMGKLLRASKDIKVSVLASEQFPNWKSNVKKLMKVRETLKDRSLAVSTISLQVTLHQKNLKIVPELIAWAETIGIDRIKWNEVVLLKDASEQLKDGFSLSVMRRQEVGACIKTFASMGSGRIKHEGSIFFEENLCAVGGICNEKCPFADEVWIYPDGHEDYCPNPQKRWGM